MAWGSAASSDVLSLNSSAYQTVQESSSDMEISLNPGELCSLIFDVDFGASADEDVDVLIVRGVDRPTIEWETDEMAEKIKIPVANKDSNDDARLQHVVAGCKKFKLRARPRDTDDTVGSDQSSTLTVHYEKDGVSL